MINCEFQNLRDVFDNESNKIGEIYDTFSCEYDDQYAEIITNGSETYNIIKTVTLGDIAVFWFALLFLVGFVVLFIIKFVRNKNVF